MNNKKGFTLIEIMIALSIVGILGAIAIPAYQNYTQKAHAAQGLAGATIYKNLVSHCFHKNGNLDNCNSGDGGIPIYTGEDEIEGIKILRIQKGVIIADLNATDSSRKYNDPISIKLVPKLSDNQSVLNWNLYCTDYSKNKEQASIVEGCVGQYYDI